MRQVTVTSSSGTPAVPVALRPRDLPRPATATGGGVIVSISQEIIDYTHGLGLLSQRTTLSRFYRWDGIGTLHNLEDSSRNVVASSVFDAYGLQRNAVTLASAYGFIGEEDVRGEKGLPSTTLVPYHMRARMYDPLTGRFTSRDPIWNRNLYEYGNGNPWSYTDAEGMDALSVEEHDIFSRYPGLTEHQRKRVIGLLDVINAHGGRYKDPGTFGEPELWRLLGAYGHPGMTHLTASELDLVHHLGVPPTDRSVLRRAIDLRYIPGAEGVHGAINYSSPAVSKLGEYAWNRGYSPVSDYRSAAGRIAPAASGGADSFYGGTAQPSGADPLMPTGMEVWVGRKAIGAFPIAFEPGTATFGGASRAGIAANSGEPDDDTADVRRNYYSAIGRSGRIIGGGILPLAIGGGILAAVPGGSGGKSSEVVAAEARAATRAPTLFWHGSEEAVRMRNVAIDAETGARGIFLPVRAGEVSGVGGKLWVTNRTLDRTGAGHWLIGGNFNMLPLVRRGAKGGFAATYALSPKEARLFQRAWGPEFSWNLAQWLKGVVGQHYYAVFPATPLKRASELSGNFFIGAAGYEAANGLAWVFDPVEGPIARLNRARGRRNPGG